MALHDEPILEEKEGLSDFWKADMQDLLVVYIAYIVAAGSPGPSNMAIMNVAMSQGRRPALALAAGVITMSTCWGLIAATGISTLLVGYAHALLFLKIAGGLYLLWLAWRAARSAAAADAPARKLARPSTDLGVLYRRGILMHLGNPKAVLAWVAIMSLGLKPGASPEMAVTAFGGCVLFGISIFAGYALLFSTAPMVHGYARARRWIEASLAVFFAGAGSRLLFSN
ncbi:leucine efflux protein [Rhizobium leguminosarum bv. phaseoli CCGM1]|nr:leucine efflux protein [Rhizobium leguminosarum bv. phaseoli CCGM1]